MFINLIELEVGVSEEGVTSRDKHVSKMWVISIYIWNVWLIGLITEFAFLNLN